MFGPSRIPVIRDWRIRRVDQSDVVVWDQRPNRTWDRRNVRPPLASRPRAARLRPPSSSADPGADVRDVSGHEESRDCRWPGPPRWLAMKTVDRPSLNMNASRLQPLGTWRIAYVPPNEGARMTRSRRHHLRGRPGRGGGLRVGPRRLQQRQRGDGSAPASNGAGQGRRRRDERSRSDPRRLAGPDPAPVREGHGDPEPVHWRVRQRLAFAPGEEHATGRWRGRRLARGNDYVLER